MIKIIIKEQVTRAGTAAAGTQAIKSYYNPNKTKTKDKNKEATPVTDTESSQPKEPTSEPASEASIPSSWKPEIGTEIEFKGVKYKANSIGGWLPNGIGLPIPKTSPIFSTLNTLAYNEEQKKKGQSTSTTATPVQIGPEDAETEEDQPRTETDNNRFKINYVNLFNTVRGYELNDLKSVNNFISTTVKYLEQQHGKEFSKLHEEIVEIIERESLKIFKDFKFIKNVEDASRTVANLFLENRKNQQILEAIDPTIAIAILTGAFLTGGVSLRSYFKNKELVKNYEDTPEAQYLKKVSLFLLLRFLWAFIVDQNNVDYFKNEAVSYVEHYMQQFKKSKFIFFRQGKLFKQIDNDLKREAEELKNEIKHLSDQSNNSTPIVSESTINRWKTLAGIRG